MDLKQRPGGIVYLNLTFWEEGVNFLPLLLICYVLRIKLKGNIFNLDFFLKGLETDINSRLSMI